MDYLEDEERDRSDMAYVMESLTSLSSMILTKINPKLRYRYLGICCQQPLSSEPLPKFIDAKLQYTFSTIPYFTPGVQQAIHKPGQDQAMVTTTMTYFNYKPTSDDMLSLTQALRTIRSEEVFKTQFVKKLIHHLWAKTKFVTFTCGAIYSLYMFLFSVYIGLGQSIPAYEAVLLCFNSLLLVAEIAQMHMLRSKYLKDAWNLIDLVQNFLAMTFIALRLDRSRVHNNVDDNADRTLAEQWMSSLAILTGYLRWVSYLRIFTPTRNVFFSFC